MKCLIVDDDQMSRESLSMMCAKIDDLEVVGICKSGMEAISKINSEDIDLILLDIKMPDLSGMDLIKSVEELPLVIFTTGHAEYAVEAFEQRVTDFLTKPVEFPRLLKAISYAREQLSDHNSGTPMREIFLKLEGRYVRLDLNEVLYIESLGDYVTFRTEKGKFVVHSTLKNIDEKITSSDFLKVHRSYIVNLSKVVDIEETNMVIHDKVIPISRAHRPTLMKRIKTI